MIYKVYLKGHMALIYTFNYLQNATILIQHIHLISYLSLVILVFHGDTILSKNLILPWC